MSSSESPPTFASRAGRATVDALRVCARALDAAAARAESLAGRSSERSSVPPGRGDEAVEPREPAAGDQPVTGGTSAGVAYGEHWLPADVAQAIAVIYNTDSIESFEEGGRKDAEALADYFTADSTVLDLGCGIGRVARNVSTGCRTLWAVDASERMLALAAEYLVDRPNVRFARCLDTDVPDVPDASVDLAYSLLVLQHLEREDAFRLLRELVRVLRPGAMAYLTFPNLLTDPYLEAFLAYVDSGEVANPIRARFYTPEEVRRLLPAAGFEVVEIQPGTEIVAIVRRPGTVASPGPA